ncbi:MAG: hypothetical protein HQK49_04215 [Oligoflexia bacterium]|nr:hypothetical protein [Oligoflexia bacterium]
MSMKNSILFLLLGLLFLVGCKSTEDLRREKMLEEINSKVGQSDVRMSESGRLVSNHSIKISELESLINKNNGATEDLKYRLSQQEKKSDEKITMLTKRIDEIFSILEEQKQKNLILEKELGEQKKYIEDVLAALDKIRDMLKAEEKEKEREKAKAKKAHQKKDKKVKDKDKDKDNE